VIPTSFPATIATKRILRAWRSGGVANADQANKAARPAIMLGEDLQEGLEPPKRCYGPGAAGSNRRRLGRYVPDHPGTALRRGGGLG